MRRLAIDKFPSWEGQGVGSHRKLHIASEKCDLAHSGGQNKRWHSITADHGLIDADMAKKKPSAARLAIRKSGMVTIFY